MYGLEAINDANGWAMAAVGATIVITGLSVLSCIISQFHHLVVFFEDKNINPKTKSVSNDDIVEENISKISSNEMEEASNVYISLTSHKLGKNFYLTDLYKLSNTLGLPHPYISIRDFRNSGILISSGEGRFSWKSTSA